MLTYLSTNLKFSTKFFNNKRHIVSFPKKFLLIINDFPESENTKRSISKI